MSYSKKYPSLSAILLAVFGLIGVPNQILAAEDSSIESSSSSAASSKSLAPITLLDKAKSEEDYKSQKEVDVESEVDIKSKKQHILFVCSGNSCRSQIAEGWARYLGGDIADIRSAGIKSSSLNLNAIKVMKESGVDISSQTSKVITPDMLQWADLVVTVCGNADQSCPALPGKVKKVHWPIKDPTKATGTEESVIGEYQSARDEIRKHVAELLLEKETLQ